MSFDVGHRVGVVEGGLNGYYGHVTDRVVELVGNPIKITLSDQVVGVTLKGLRDDADFLQLRARIGQEWFIPTRYLEHID